MITLLIILNFILSCVILALLLDKKPKVQVNSLEALEKRVRRKQLERMEEEYKAQEMGEMISKYVQVSTQHSASEPVEEERTPVGYVKD